MSKVTFSTLDRQSKDTSMTIGADDAVLEADVDALATAIDALIRGSAVKAERTVTTVMQAGSQVPPADEEANRGNKWLIRVESIAGLDAGKIYRHTIGTADNTLLPSPTDDFLDLTAGVGLAFKTAFEAVYESPIGSAGQVVSVQQVTRTD